MSRKPYRLWYKQKGEWIKYAESDDPTALDFMAGCRFYTGAGTTLERIELRDHSGVLKAYFDSSWNEEETQCHPRSPKESPSEE